MNITRRWKTLTVGAVTAAISVTGIVTGITTAQAAGSVAPPPPAAAAPVAKIPYAPPPSAAPAGDSTGGAHVEHTQTAGSTAIRTSARAIAEVATVSPHLLRTPQAD
jgi:hypothetical protein